LGVGRYDFEVAQVVDITPSMRRIVLTAAGLEDFAPAPGQDLMITVDATPGAVVRRRYTIRGYDRPNASVALHVLVHGNGPGSRWAAGASAGSRIEGIGPRGKITLASDADWHLFAGDETFVPAAYAMLEALPSGACGIGVFEVGSSVDERPLTPAIVATVEQPTWLHRGGPTTIPDVLAGLALPEGLGQAYVGGEARLVRDVRRALLGRGFTAERIAAKAYWRADLANARHGEPDALEG
jgi:NADPH-dependent ferric siderophore reductase